MGLAGGYGTAMGQARSVIVKGPGGTTSGSGVTSGDSKAAQEQLRLDNQRLQVARQALKSQCAAIMQSAEWRIANAG
jgi:hypothetical protein